MADKESEMEPPIATPVRRNTPPQLQEFTQAFSHTRQCNKREVCSCLLRYESKWFHQHLTKHKTSSREKRMRVKGTAVVFNMQQFETTIKTMIQHFLSAWDLATLSMVNRQWRSDNEAYAERKMKSFLLDESRSSELLKVTKAENQTWTQYMHLQTNSIHKLFVYYTAYKTGLMRRDTPQWAFGEVAVDPNDPMRTILPNEWQFNGHSPWHKRRGNGKGGEWMLLDRYKHGRAPADFVKNVNDWARTLRPGSHLTVAFQQEGSTQVNWWEAQVWYVWRADGREDPAIVFDPVAETEYEVNPRRLTQYFQANPEHVIDVCTTPRSVCSLCRPKGRSFHLCHVEKGHTMS